MTDRERSIETVCTLLRKYRVQRHYRASTDAKVSRYAVFDETGQITEPRPFAETKAEAQRLTANAIVDALCSG